MGGLLFRRAVTGFATSVLFLATSSGLAEPDIQITASTDYRQRGLQQNDHGIALQGLLEQRFDNGLFLGVWASRVNFGSFDDRNFELDFFVGYGARTSPSFAYDLTIIRYTYPNNAEPRDYNWTEFIASAYLGDRWLLSAGTANNWLAFEDRTHFAEVSYRHPLPFKLTLDITIGYQELPDPVPDYQYGEFGVSRRLGPVDVRVGYAESDGNAEDWFGPLVEHSRWLASLTYRI